MSAGLNMVSPSFVWAAQTREQREHAKLDALLRKVGLLFQVSMSWFHVSVQWQNLGGT